MGGTSTQQQTQSSKTSPWKPAQAGLKSILGAIQPSIDNAGLTGAESGALDAMSANASQGNPFSPQITSLANSLFGGGTDRTGIATDAYGTLQQQLGGTARGDYLDPNTNPFFAQTMQGISGDVMNRVNGMFAGAGRDLSGANLNTLAGEITKASAPVFAQVYGDERARQLAAQEALYGAGNNTAGLLSGLDQIALQNRQAGIGVGEAALGAENYGPQQQLAIEAMRRGIPLDQLAKAAGIVGGIAGLGSQSQGTSNTTSQMSGAQQFNLIAGGLGAMMPKPPGPGQIA